MQNEINAGRFGQFATRLFGIKGSNPAPQLAPEVMLVADITEPPSDGFFIQDIRLAQGRGLAPGAPGDNAYVALTNNTPGLIITLTELLIVNIDATPHGFDLRQTSTVPAGTPGNKDFRDTRVQGAPAGLITFGNNATAAFPAPPQGDAGFYEVQATASLLDNAEYVLTPGNTVGIVINVQNVAARATFWWRERAALPSELS